MRAPGMLLAVLLDGFDQIEVAVRIDYSAPAKKLRVYIPVSEAGGWGQVDLVEKP